MYSKDMLIGIFLAKANGHISITKNDEILIGYRTKLSINIRGSADFLHAIQRSLIQYGIESNYKAQQSKSRPTPILIITGIKNVALVVHNFLVKLPDANNNFADFKKAVRIVAEARHLQLEGLEELFKLKGVM